MSPASFMIEMSVPVKAVNMPESYFETKLTDLTGHSRLEDSCLS